MATILQTEQKQIVAYLRVSTDMQTVENQRLELTKYAERNNLKIVNFFEDEAISGTVPPQERPGFRALMDFIKTNNVNHVLVFDLTRVGRTFWDTLVAIREIERYSMLISSSPKDAFLNVGQESMRQIFFSMLAWFAERERDMLIERIRAGMARAKLDGVKLGRNEKPFTDDEMMQLLHMLQSGRSESGHKMVMLAKQFGLSHTTLYRKLHESGYLHKTVRIDAAKLLDCREQNMTRQDISKELGVSVEDVDYALHKLNIRGYQYVCRGTCQRYCIVRHRPHMTIIKFRKVRKLSVRASQ
jgi:putative DNA-invertase from lambdoid prophage Rac